MGASPSPATGAGPSAAPDSTAAPGASAPSSGKVPRGPLSAFGLPFGGGPGFAAGPGSAASVSVASRSPSVDGSNVSLKTDDGWTRTIAVTADTKITKGGATIKVGDLAAGDHVRIAQTRASDGTYTVNAIIVVLPSLAGQVERDRRRHADGHPARRDDRDDPRHAAARPTRSTARRARCPISRSVPSSSPRARSGPTARSMPRWFAVASVAVAFQAARASVRASGAVVTGKGRRRAAPPRRAAQADRRAKGYDRGAVASGLRAAVDSQAVLTVAAFDGGDPDTPSRSQHDRSTRCSTMTAARTPSR